MQNIIKLPEIYRNVVYTMKKGEICLFSHDKICAVIIKEETGLKRNRYIFLRKCHSLRKSDLLPRNVLQFEEYFCTLILKFSHDTNEKDFNKKQTNIMC